jgi:uncharacterized membrane protein
MWMGVKMNKEDFRYALRKKLAQLPNDEIDKSISYFDEMIADRMEDGMSEEEAVKEFENVNEIAEKIMTEMSMYKLVKTRVKPEKDYTILEILLLVLGFPVWFPLIISFFAIVASIFITIFSIIFSFYAVFVGIFILGIAGLICSPMIFVNNFYTGLLMLSVSLMLIGFSVFLFYAVTFISKKMIEMMKLAWMRIKKAFIKREVEQ